MLLTSEEPGPVTSKIPSTDPDHATSDVHSIANPDHTYCEKRKIEQTVDVQDSKSVFADAIICEYKKRLKTSNNNRKEPYSDDMKKFALTMHGYSPKAYRFLRETFDYALPSEITIHRWLEKIDYTPGFSYSSLSMIQ